ncbi:MAG TPA: hypothetical protein VFN21_01010 [Acidimicrobiales bacterium]|nr:hypothetical protein [Acidimicrobiales bacterium]
MTKDDLRVESAALRLEVNTVVRSECDKLRTELKSDMAELRTEIGGIRTELKSDIGGLRSETGGIRTELKSDIGGLRSEIDGLRSDMNQLVYWVIGTGLAFTGLLSGLIVVVH